MKRLIELVELKIAVEAADMQAGRTVVKPAGQKARECFAIPVEAWERVQAALAKYEEAR